MGPCPRSEYCCPGEVAGRKVDAEVLLAIRFASKELGTALRDLGTCMDCPFLGRVILGDFCELQARVTALVDHTMNACGITDEDMDRFVNDTSSSESSDLAVADMCGYRSNI